MNHIPVFKSDLAPYMTSYCEQSLPQASTFRNHLRILCQLDAYCCESGHSLGYLDENLVTGFMEFRGNKSRADRVWIIRSFAYYMQQAGFRAYVVPLFFDRLKRPFHKTFESQFKDRMEAFLSEKRALGYKYQNESYFLRYFDNFIVSKGYGETELTRQMVLEYSLRPETESMRTRRNKLSIVKLFGQYLVRNGENAYIYDEVLRDPKQVPYVFDPSETKAFFQALDSNKYRFHWGRYQYPVYFRVLYTTGMRESEVCCIKRADIDYEKHRFLVRDAKGQKDRYVYFSEPTCKMLICFDAKLEQFFPNRVYLFIGTTCTPDSHVSNATVRHAFRKCWAAAGLPYDRANGISPCVHSFRHTYVLDRISQWQLEGRNVDALLPYLSKQLGHKSLEETYRYCMRLDTRFNEIIKPSQIAKNIIPEVSP